ncbi:unnamed protein product [Nesidiocoris tenuis]|uniref:Ankyrin ubiquitin-binding domain-containing protein n=1 Tax=Nesidiocoris tenuis TaxID=355587 RepID=A0A6H5H599_9HEMI|nr:unnamed protein product [Nesidiocoris tenuis]
MPESQWSFLYFCPSPTSISSPCNNYEYDTRKKEVDWTWLNACKGVVDGDPAPVAAYLTSGGSPTRTLTPIEVQILSRDSAFDVGHTLVHLAIRYLSVCYADAHFYGFRNQFLEASICRCCGSRHSAQCLLSPWAIREAISAPSSPSRRRRPSWRGRRLKSQKRSSPSTTTFHRFAISLLSTRIANCCQFIF